MKRTILIVAAHPDDEVLGAGGAIARHREEGDAVTILILGAGVAARAGLSPQEIKDGQARLTTAASRAAAALGASEPILRSLPDNEFDTISLLSIVHSIEEVIEAVRPHIVYTHHAGDVNIDHRVVSEAVEAATRPLAGSILEEVRAFEVPSSTEWNFARQTFRPNIFVALSAANLAKKLKALDAYESEMRDFPHPRSIEYIEALARVRGGQSGLTAAEAFELRHRRLL